MAVLAVDTQLRDVYPTYRRLKTLVREALDAVVVSGEAAAPGVALRVAPNPARRRVAVETGGAGTLRLLDARGRDVMAPRTVAAAGRIRVTLDGIAPGVYTLRLEAGGRTTTRRLVVTR